MVGSGALHSLRAPAIRTTIPTTGRHLETGLRALEEHRSEDVGTVEELVGAAEESDLALFHEHGSLGNAQRHVDGLFDEDDRRALVMDRSHDLEKLLNDGRRKT